MKLLSYLVTGVCVMAVAAMVYGSPQSVLSETQQFVGTGSSLVLNTNKDRGYLIIQNNGSSVCNVKFGSAITGTEGFLLQTQQNYEVQDGYPKTSVYMKCNTASQPIELMEGNF